MSKKIAILVESNFIYEEIMTYYTKFHKYGAKIDLLTDLSGKSYRTLISQDNQRALQITKDLQYVNANEYDIILVSANYISCESMSSQITAVDLEYSSAIQFIKSAMVNKSIIKGMLCTGLGVLTSIPQYLQNRRVICHTSMTRDIVNAGAYFVNDGRNIVVDNDIVTSHSLQYTDSYVDAIINAYESKYHQSNFVTVSHY